MIIENVNLTFPFYWILSYSVLREVYVNGLRYVFAPTTSIWKALKGGKLGRTKLAEMWFISLWSMVSGIKKRRIVSSCDSTCYMPRPFKYETSKNRNKRIKKNHNNNNKNINRNESSKSYLFQCWPLYPNHTMMLRGTKKYITKNNWNWNNWSCYTSAVKSGYCCNSLLQTWFLYSVSLDENYHRMFARMLRQT